MLSNFCLAANCVQNSTAWEIISIILSMSVERHSIIDIGLLQRHRPIFELLKINSIASHSTQDILPRLDDFEMTVAIFQFRFFSYTNQSRDPCRLSLFDFRLAFGLLCLAPSLPFRVTTGSRPSFSSTLISTPEPIPTAEVTGRPELS